MISKSSSCSGYALHATSIGWVCIGYEDEAVTRIEWLGDASHIPPLKEDQSSPTPLTQRTALQLQEYLDGTRQTFTIPFMLHGTPFQRKVWAALQDIPYGTTCSYRDIAERIGCPKGCRAIGMANHRNPIPFIVPCHRVVNADGSLGGYAYGKELKQRLIERERRE